MTERGFLPYGRQSIGDDDVAAVARALRSDFLTTGPEVPAFEAEFAVATGAAHAVACNSGTAALHLALAALGTGPGDVCIVPAITFVATANAARYCGADVVFADVDPDTGLMTPDSLRAALDRCGGRRVRAVLPVHLAGQCADMPAIAEISQAAGAAVVEDACHALGSLHAGGRRTGDCAFSAMACFSFHPVKTIACGEGGMVTSNDPALAGRMARLRSHGIERDPDRFEDAVARGQPWRHELQELGWNHRLPDINAALGRSQLAKLPQFAQRRRALAAAYDAAMPALAPLARPPGRVPDCDPCRHLYVARIDFAAAGKTRAAVMAALAAQGIGTQVHYYPVNAQPYYVRLYGEHALKGAAEYYETCLSLPLYPGMDDGDPALVVETLGKVLGV
ncbi:MAG: UDP-4-amino-4,6-dideoxy-N-acetyl-beta-L-altrosamine transaminase [Maricaulaceae bacterium]|nr:UDP-4-amino-4,6-dideoxy-N-acetyl-beta-L-altrosamine transaminase [Maricaulaceae bacterium]